jgi:hypothetical protein
LTLTVSTRQPACDTELSEHILQRNFTGWPAPEAGRLTVTVSNPPEPALEIPLQLGRLGRHGLEKLVLMSVWLYPPVTKLPPAATMSWNAPPLMLISITPASKATVALDCSMS